MDDGRETGNPSGRVDGRGQGMPTRAEVAGPSTRAAPATPHFFGRLSDDAPMGSDTDPRLTGVPRSGAIRGWEDEAPDPQVIDSPPAAPPSPHPGAAARSAAEAPSRHLRPPPRRPDRFRHREPRRWGPQKTFLVVVIGLFAMFSGLAIAAATWTTKHVEDTVERVPHVFPTGDRPAQAVAGLTFRLVGRARASQSDTASLADSIMLIHVNGSRKDAQVLYLPVSAQLEPGGPTLDEVFGEGGPAQLIGDVEGFTGIRIDHYAELDFA